MDPQFYIHVAGKMYDLYLLHWLLLPVTQAHASNLILNTMKDLQTTVSQNVTYNNSLSFVSFKQT